jgi:hypothetical protein
MSASRPAASIAVASATVGPSTSMSSGTHTAFGQRAATGTTSMPSLSMRARRAIPGDPEPLTPGLEMELVHLRVGTVNGDHESRGAGKHGDRARPFHESSNRMVAGRRPRSMVSRRYPAGRQT